MVCGSIHGKPVRVAPRGNGAIDTGRKGDGLDRLSKGPYSLSRMKAMGSRPQGSRLGLR